MTITIIPVKKINTSCEVYKIEAQLYYPKLLLFESNKSVHIVDITRNNKETPDEIGILRFNQEIVDKLLCEHLLWLVFKSGDITVVDVFKGTQIQITNESDISLKICQIGKYGDRIHFASESGDSFLIPYNVEDLIAKLEDAKIELRLPFKKTHDSHLIIKSKFNNTMCGLNILIEEGAVNVKCPLTGILEVISTQIKVKHIIVWRDFAILSNESVMWIVDIKESQIIYQFERTESSYYPVLAHNDLLYYLLWNKEEIHICSAGFAQSSLKLPGGTDNYESFNQTLTPQDALRAQLKSLLDSVTDSVKPVTILPQLMTLFDSIDDFSFLIETIQKLCQYNITYKSLLYPLQKRILASDNNDLINSISDLSNKIDLIEYIHFTGNNSYENINLFEQSYKELCVTFITNCDFDIASICWLKYSQLSLPITADDVVNILNSINNSTKLASIIILLKNIIPSLLEKNPFYIDLFVRWASERVLMLENSAFWPKIGLKFVEEIILILETSLKSISLRPISMDDLDLLKNRIINIMELKDKYKINVLLHELSSQNPNEVALIMLRRCYTEDLNSFLNNYLPSYSMRHIFDLDDILNSYIESEAASSGGGIDGTRLMMLLESFHSYNNKLECLLQVLKVLDVPWSSVVLDLAVNMVANTTKTFTMSDSERLLSQEIQKEINYANVKVVLKKYNFPMTCTDYMLVLHKIVSAPVIELADLKIITGVMHAYSNYGNALYIERCLQDCETRVALIYFNNLSLKEKKLLLKAVTAKYDQIICGSTRNMTIERNYIDFIKGTQLLNETEINNIETMYNFKNSYNLLLNLNDIYNENVCENSVNSWICNDGATASSGRGGSVIQLTQACQSQNSVLMALLRSTSTSQQVRKIVEYLIRSFSTKDVSVDEFLAVLSQFEYGENSGLLIQSYNVLIELSVNCNEEYLHSILKQLALLNNLMNASIIIKNLSIVWKFYYVYLPISSNTAVNEFIHMHKVIQYPDLFNASISDLYSKCDFTSLRMISNFLLNSKIPLPTWQDYVNEMSKRLISKIVAYHELDQLLMTFLLLIMRTYEENSACVIEVLKGQNECLPPNILGYLSIPSLRRTFLLESDSYSKEIGNSVTYPPQYILKSRFNINLADVALPENSEETWDVKVILFYVLLQYPDTCFERLFDLCRALNISTNDGLSLQLIALLSTWELNYKIYTDTLGHRQIYFEKDKKYLNKCFIVWDSIENREFLKDILNDFWKNGEVTLHGRAVSINPYYYEVFLCIYHLIFGNSIEVKNTKEYFLLHFLKEYRRKSTPKQYEYELFSVKGMFPEIGHFRLPFHLFMREDMWSNLKSEITLETYERWIPAVALLALDSDSQTARDMICSNAVKQTMTTRKRNDDDTDTKNEPWRLTTEEEPLLRAAHRCVRYIANMEWAGACLFYVLQGCARGADQVAAAHLCYQFAQRWAALQPGNRAVRQMERLHATLSTRHALYKIDWACEELLKLSTEPAQLIRALYLHPEFVPKMNRYDVNRAVNEIADKNGINVSSIRIQILENILNKSNGDSKQVAVLSIKELMTAKYILKATCPKMGAIYLSRITFDDESDNNKSKKLRALQCLMSIVDTDTAIKVANRERDALWISLLELLSIVNLESIDMPWIAATFTHDKIRGLEQLLQSSESNAEGLKIAAELSCKFGSAQIMRKLIPLLLRAGLYEEMIPLLLKLTSQIDNVICTAWRAVILSPFQRADYPITERQRVKCLNAINLLPICPIIKDEDLVEIWKNCVRCKVFGLGCLVLPYMTSQTRQSLIELQKIDRRNLIASLKNLHADTYLVSGAMHVIERMASRVYR